MSYIIRAMENADVSEVSVIFNSILDELHGRCVTARDSYRQQYTPERLHILLSDPTAVLYICTLNNIVVGFGFGRVTGGVGLDSLDGIRPGMRGGRIGRQMLDCFLKEFEDRGCHKVELYTYQSRPKLESSINRSDLLKRRD